MAFQFTPLREGRRAPVWYHIIRSNISIHAPPRGATRKSKSSLLPTCDFNSRPSARGDRARPCRTSAQWRFQFTPLREGRLSETGRYQAGEIISIHAPPRGATMASIASEPSASFQFTPLREGRRTVSKSALCVMRTFQFTPLREGRLDEVRRAIPPEGFQFTPLREGRPMVLPITAGAA